MSLYTKLLPIVLSCLMPFECRAADVEFSENNWAFEGVEWQRVSYLGRDALFLQNANATLRDVDFYNGTIEFDAAVNGERGFTSIRWRRQADASGENFLIRNHKSGERDSAQYEAFHGYRSSWQLYNGDGHTTHIDIPKDTWIPFRIVVRDGSADVYVNSDEPILHIGRLRGADKPGGIQLNGALVGAHFSNFRFDPSTPDELSGKSMNLPAPPTPEGAIRQWSLSNALVDGSFAGVNVLPEGLGIETWTTVTTDEAGLINLSEYLPASGFNRADDDLSTAVVRTEIDADRERSVQMKFGYSDYVQIYLNRRLLFSGKNRFREDDRRYQGLVDRNTSIVLNLKAGSNELTMVLREDDRFGWGFLTELADTEGLIFQ